VEAQPYEAGHRLLVTSLYPRSFPLVRYDMGDEIVVGGDARGPILGLEAFERVIGRCNEYVALEDGSIIHSEVFTHAVRACPQIGAYQVAQVGNEVHVRYLAAAELDPRQVEEIRGRLARAHATLAGARIERVTHLDRTIAGKSPMVVRKTAPAGEGKPGTPIPGTR
jgi:phenylacetate-coenzyme A ligase PaaK-like adenylate-forming protein